MTTYDALKEKMEEIAHLKGAASIMMWDQEVMMPKGGNGLRAKQLSTIFGLHHHKVVHEAGPLLEKVRQSGENLDDFQKRNMKVLEHEHERFEKIPNKHVREFSQLCSESLQAWAQAKAGNDFSKFEPNLEKLVEMKIREAEYLGYENNPYDPLIDQYEPEMTAATLRKIFDAFKPGLSSILEQIADQPQVDEKFLNQSIPSAEQLAWGSPLLEKLGYDMAHGRQDISLHPFSIGIGPSDVRITTIVSENDIREMLFSSIHEAGHAMYEQGLPDSFPGMPAGEACSLGIHESQSRLWENNVARSLPFWEHYTDDIRKLYPDSLKGRDANDLFRAVNLVKPNFVRISSDELTYHFHIILRFEIEDDLINGRLKVRDLPEAWNANIKSYLGLDVKEDSKGVLQDIHWSHGSFGYFPTYSLGSFYAAQFMAAAKKAMPGLDDEFRSGDFSNIKSWLRKNIHAHGKQYSAEELCEMATGERLNVDHFLSYARQKYGQVYGIEIK